MTERHCSTCTCGLTEVTWSDRGGWVDLSDPESVARTVLSCALDHSYDRTSNGIPYGVPSGIIDLLAPIVRKHLAAVEPNWENVSVDMTDEQEKAFKQELVEALKGGKNA